MYQIYMPNCCENDGIKKCETEKWTEFRSMRKMAQFDFVIKRYVIESNNHTKKR